MSIPVKTMPAVFGHCEAIYKAMEERSEPDEDGNVIYQGHLTKLFRTCNLSVPYYTAVMGHLKRMDCVRQLYRGGGGSESRWVILQPPTVELFETSPGFLKKTSADEMQAQQIRDLQTQINDIKSDTELRFAQLEAKIG